MFGALLIVLAQQHIRAHRYEQAQLPLETSYGFLVDKSPSQELLTSCFMLVKIHRHAKRLQEADFYNREVKRVKKLLEL